jgi:2'-5' RNA ligase
VIAPLTAAYAPLIVTLAFDDASFAHFDALRRRHFPAERNVIPAHLTLFHHLPGEREPEIAERLREIAREAPPLTLQVTGLRSLGRGVAFALASEALSALRARLARDWADGLTPQDRQNFRAHVTIQNKVSSQAARALHATLQAGFAPFSVQATGLLLWRYRGGPWEAAGTFPFGGALSQQRFLAEPRCG